MSTSEDPLHSLSNVKNLTREGVKRNEVIEGCVGGVSVARERGCCRSCFRESWLQLVGIGNFIRQHRADVHRLRGEWLPLS